MNFKRFHESKNLFDYSTVTTGYRIQWITGDNYPDDTAVRSDYIPVSSGTYSCSDSVIVLGYDASKNFIGATNGDGVFEKIAKNPTSQFTIPTNSLCKYVKILAFDSSVPMNIDTETMLNTGSQPLPYEPYSSEVWHDISHYIHNTSTDTLTTLPAVIYPNDTTATVGLKGNTIQNDTPTPDNPIIPQGTGERTANIFDYTKQNTANGYVDNAYINQYGATISENIYAVSEFIEVTGAYISLSVPVSLNSPAICFYNAEKQYISGKAYNLRSTVTEQIPRNAVYIRFTIVKQYASTTMVNLGNTLQPYEPYGYKIPISSANTTTNVYLGEVETTKKIRKLVLTGQETNWIYEGVYERFGMSVSDMFVTGTRLETVICSHYQCIDDGRAIGNVPDNSIYLGLDSPNKLWIKTSSYTSVTAFKQWLADQYTTGTPVTVWYPLTNEETDIVNEPLMKIGNYADGVSNVSVPTITGVNTISVDTTVQPSEVTVNYKGWHPLQSVHEYDSNYTIATMQTLTIAQLQTHTINELQGGEWL